MRNVIPRNKVDLQRIRYGSLLEKYCSAVHGGINSVRLMPAHFRPDTPTPMPYSRHVLPHSNTHNPIIAIRHLRALHLRTRTYSRPFPATVGYPHSMTACAHNPFPSRHCPPRTQHLAQPVPREYRSLTRADTCFRRPSILAHRHKKLSPAPMPKPVPNALHLTRFA